ncbi:MAG TPA: hypothetical protein DHV07_06910 [Flavobacteriales bacterium]|nr:hypothetical protein [Flavobacteriales bacterium]
MFFKQARLNRLLCTKASVNDLSTEHILIGMNSAVPEGPVHAESNYGVQPRFVVFSKQQELGTGLG